MLLCPLFPFLFFFNDTATTEIYTLSLHDALPISWRGGIFCFPLKRRKFSWGRDRKSTRLNSSHQIISYAVFCLKKKKQSISLEHSKTLYVRAYPGAGDTFASG